MIHVYTANVGEHDPPRHSVGGLQVFTEDLMGNPKLSACFYKCNPHLLFPKAEWTIWIDANVFLKKTPEFFVEYTLATLSTYGAFAHFFRAAPHEEAKAILDFRLDSENRVARTMSRYRQWESHHGQAKHLAQNFILVRKNTPENTCLNTFWWADICWCSHRDQLSMPLFYPGPYWPTVDFTKPNDYFERISK